jgi:uncharacterized GH25 family protein
MRTLLAVLLLVISTGPTFAAPATRPVTADDVYKQEVAKWDANQKRYVPDPSSIAPNICEEAQAGLPMENGRLLIPRGADGKALRDGQGYAAQYFVAAPKPGSITGQVVDENNQPVPRATISGDLEFNVGQNLNGSYTFHPVLADESGRFTVARVPIGMYTMRARAIGHMTREISGVTVTAQALKATITLTAHTAIPLRGTVLNPAGAPMAGVRVQVSAYSSGPQRYRWGGFSAGLSDTTNAEGKFSIVVEEEGAYNINVEPKSGAADDIAYDLPLGKDNVIRLQPGGTITGRLVAGDDHKPLAHVKVRASVEDRRSYSYLRERLVDTDEQGRFTFPDLALEKRWEYGPVHTSPRTWSIGCRGFSKNVDPKENESIDIGDLAVSTFSNWTLSGHVTDAAGHPVRQFKLYTTPVGDGHYSPTWRYVRARDIESKDGRFSVYLDSPGSDIYVRVEATGFLPFTSAPIVAKSETIDLPIQLEVERPIAGVVLDDAGAAVAGAEVAMFDRSNLVNFRNGHLNHNEDSAIVKTDEAGHFSLRSQGNAVILFAMNDVGYVRADGVTAGKVITLKLRKWARVEGTVQFGHTPAVGAAVTVYSEDYRQQMSGTSPQIIFMYEAKSDAKGHFVFDRVMPAKGFIAREVPMTKGEMSSISYSNTQEIVTQSGQTLSVAIGGKGRPVVGKLAPAVPLDQIDFIYAESGSGDEVHGQHLAPTVNADGTFRFEDVPPGAYTLMIDKGPINQSTRIEKTFTVPDGPDAISDVPFEIGNIDTK